MNPGFVTASFKRDAHETMGFPFPASFCTAISLVILVFSFSAPSGAATKSEWVPAREAKGCFLRRRQKSRRIDFWRNRKRAAPAAGGKQKPAHRQAGPQRRPARRNDSQLAEPARRGRKGESITKSLQQ